MSDPRLRRGRWTPGLAAVHPAIACSTLLCSALVCSALAAPGAFAQDGAHVCDYLHTGGGTDAAFRPVAAALHGSVVRIEGGFRTVQRGTIVDSSGVIVTKASELPASPRCVFADGKVADARVVGVDDEWDLAVLQVEGANFSAAHLETDPHFKVGAFLVSVGPGMDEVDVGITSVPPRRIPPQRGFLGVNLADATDGVRVTQVVPESAAFVSRLSIDDRLTSINGRPVRSIDECIRLIASNPPGTTVELGVSRAGQSLQVSATLGERPEPADEDYGDGDLNRRRSGFPLAVQHDTALEPDQIGGPVVDTHGRVIGINIARAGRTQTFLLPSDRVAEVVHRILQNARRA